MLRSNHSKRLVQPHVVPLQAPPPLHCHNLVGPLTVSSAARESRPATSPTNSCSRSPGSATRGAPLCWRALQAAKCGAKPNALTR